MTSPPSQVNPTSKWDGFLEQNHWFWQYPVKTEHTFYQQNKNHPACLGIPWATIIDKRLDLSETLQKIKPLVQSSREYFTCCQHIYFRKLKHLWNDLGVGTVYASHKQINENSLNGIRLIPCPLFAVNFEDPERNSSFRNKDFEKLDRKIPYSFAGGYQSDCYLSDIRPRIFAMKHPQDAVVEETGRWHFTNVVYSDKQNARGELNENEELKLRTLVYNQLLLDSRYTLAPSGSGPNSIRFWEALASGSIPILLSDTLQLPTHKLWKESILRVKEANLESIPDLIKGIDTSEERERRVNCLKIYEHFKGNFANGETQEIIPSVT